MIQYYLDEDTIPGQSYQLTEEYGAETGMCSSFVVEKAICATNAKYRERQVKCKTVRSNRSEHSIQVKLPRRVNANRGEKKRL